MVILMHDDRERPVLRLTADRAWPLLVVLATTVTCLTVLPAAMASASGGPCDDDGSTTKATHHDDEADAHSSDSSSEAKTIIFLFGTIAGGALLRQVFKNTGVPYTVSLMVVGLAIGMCSNVSPDVRQ